MFLWLWKNIRGYVMIEVTGFSVERFMNMAARKGIYMWDVERVPGGVAMRVSIKAFKSLGDCVLKTRCVVKIKEKSGLPFALHRYRKRKVLFLGTLVMVALVYYLSCFVWLIDVKGNSRVSRDQILEYCQSQGLQIGALKYKIDNKQLKTDIMGRFHDISWLDIRIKGTRAQISLVESMPKPVILDKSAPCDIVATKDGLVTSIITSAGQPKVKQNDVVKKGDVLVTGNVKAASDNGDVYTAVHASSEVWAKMYTEIALEVPYEHEEKRYSGMEESRLSVLVFGFELKLPEKEVPFVSYDKAVRRDQLKFGEDYPLPVILCKETFKEFSLVKLKRTPEQAKDLAEKMINARIIREFDFAADIIDKSVAMEETDTGLLVKALITTNERIGVWSSISSQPEA
jgi:similar to stage IV sporulation protein